MLPKKEKTTYTFIMFIVLPDGNGSVIPCLMLFAIEKGKQDGILIAVC